MIIRLRKRKYFFHRSPINPNMRVDKKGTYRMLIIANNKNKRLCFLQVSSKKSREIQDISRIMQIQPSLKKKQLLRYRLRIEDTKLEENLMKSVKIDLICICFGMHESGKKIF